MVGWNCFVNGDCMDYLPDFPDDYFDLAIVDPPYGISEDGSKNHTRSKKVKARDYKGYGDHSAPGKRYFAELIRVSKNQIIWGANHFISRIPYDSLCWIVWDKCNGNSDFADCELAWTSFRTATRKFTYMWAGMLQGKSIWEGDVHQGDKRLNEERIHPNQKPVALYDWILGKYAAPRDKILDTHVGSASSLISCYKNGFDYVGFEKDPYYYDLANRRLEAFKSQITLWDLGMERKKGGME